jgi:nicotinamide mononucleotide transporter
MFIVIQALESGWLADNYIEIMGVVTSLVYLYFSVKQRIWLWPFGILSSGLFVYIFYHTKFYAGMSLQAYYLVISTYGWYHWTHGVKEGDSPQIPVIRLTHRTGLLSAVFFIVLFIAAALILDGFTNSDVPWGDSFTTAGSIIATWMLARKILEHWLLWVIIDGVAVTLYLYKGMYPTVLLYLVYTVIAIVGFYQWRKSLIKNLKQ